MTPRALLVVLTLCACEGDDDDKQQRVIIEDDGGDLINLEDKDIDTADPLDCQSVTMKINGRSPEDTPDPTVGDHWMVRLYCDEVVMHGANRLYFAPPELATVEDFNTDADFINAGEGQMTMQSGSERMTIDITVLEAPK
jgi:hypothetical protein